MLMTIFVYNLLQFLFIIFNNVRGYLCHHAWGNFKQLYVFATNVLSNVSINLLAIDGSSFTTCLILCISVDRIRSPSMAKFRKLVHIASLAKPKANYFDAFDTIILQ